MCMHLGHKCAYIDFVMVNTTNQFSEHAVLARGNVNEIYLNRPENFKLPYYVTIAIIACQNIA